MVVVGLMLVLMLVLMMVVVRLGGLQKASRSRARARARSRGSRSSDAVAVGTIAAVDAAAAAGAHNDRRLGCSRSSSASGRSSGGAWHRGTETLAAAAATTSVHAVELFELLLLLDELRLQHLHLLKKDLLFLVALFELQLCKLCGNRRRLSALVRRIGFLQRQCLALFATTHGGKGFLRLGKNL